MEVQKGYTNDQRRTNCHGRGEQWHYGHAAWDTKHHGVCSSAMSALAKHGLITKVDGLRALYAFYYDLCVVAFVCAIALKAEVEIYAWCAGVHFF